MKPSVPVRQLNFAPFPTITAEIRQATAYYHQTLKKIVVTSQDSDNLMEFNEALIKMASECAKLSSMQVFCLFDENTVETILSLHPHLKNYTLKYDPEI